MITKFSIPVLFIGILSICLLASFTGPKPAEQKVEISTRYGKIIVKLYNETPLHRDNFIKLVKAGFYDSLLFHRVVPQFMIQGGDPSSKYAPSGFPLGNGVNGYTIPAEFNPKLYHKRGALAAARDNNPQKASSGCQFYIVQGRPFTIDEINAMANQTNLNAKSQLFNQLVESDSVRFKMQEFTLRGDKEGMHNYLLSLQPIVDSLYAPLQLKYSTEQTLMYLQVGGAPHLDQQYTVFGEVVSGMNVVDSISIVKCDQNNRPLVDLRTKMRLIK